MNKQLQELASQLETHGYVTEVSVTDRLRITHDESIQTYWLAANNDGRDRFYELRESEVPGVITSIDLPVATDLLFDQVIAHLGAG